MSPPFFAQDARSGATSQLRFNYKQTKNYSFYGEILEISGLNNPKSIIARKNYLYIANIGGIAGKSPKRGFLVISDLNGKNSRILFKGALDDPKGFAFFNDHLIILVDHPTVKVIDLDKEKIITAVQIPHAKYLNNIVVLDSKNAILSDSGTGLVHLVTSKGKKLILSSIKGLESPISGVSGLFYTNKKLYLTSSSFSGDRTAGDIYTFTFTKGWKEGILSSAWVGKKLGTGALDSIHVKGDAVLVADSGLKNKARSGGFFALRESAKKIELSFNGGTTIANFSVLQDHPKKTDKDWIFFPEASKNRIIRIRHPGNLLQQ